MQKKKVLSDQDNRPCSKSLKMMVKLNELEEERFSIEITE